MKKQAGNFILNLFFPQRCPWCQDVVGFSDRPCQCEGTLAALRRDDALYLPDSAHGGKLRVQACYAYKPPASTAVQNLKAAGDASSYREMGAAMSALLNTYSFGEEFDMLVPVPVSAKVKRQRGHNQAALLAAEVADRAGLPLLEVLCKQRETAHQRELGREERLKNLKGAFAVAVLPETIQGKRILLVDDVVTTGSTLLECAHTLRAAGAAEIGGLCFTAVGEDIQEI